MKRRAYLSNFRSGRGYSMCRSFYRAGNGWNITGMEGPIPCSGGRMDLHLEDYMSRGKNEMVKNDQFSELHPLYFNMRNRTYTYFIRNDKSQREVNAVKFSNSVTDAAHLLSCEL